MLDIKQLLEQFENYLNEKMQMEEFAEPRRELIKKMGRLAPAVMLHLLKIKYAHNVLPDTIKHWNTEIRAKLNQMIEKSFKGGKYKQQIFYDCLMDNLDNPLEMKDRRAQVAWKENIDINKLIELKPKEDFKQIQNCINQLVNLMLQHLELGKKITVDEVEQITNQLIS